ncbi:sensor histidine kinase [Rhizosphaericola mali]|uniref:sensor histidine kinase n=1 Tax=Rhizosphaericola mali TaxID=2545455 RepID=UPI00177B29A5|nr:histidine kinase [Rhizosphaericola mali]
MAILLLLVLPLDWVLLLSVTKVSMYFHWNNPQIQEIWDFYSHTSPYSIVYVLLYLSSTFWATIPLILIKIVIEIYQNAQTQKLLQERNNELQFEKAQSNIPSEWLRKSLDEIHANLKENPPAQKAVEQLSQLLNFAFVKSREKNVLLTDEILFLNNFLEFERMRHNPEKVSIQFEYTIDTNNEKSIAPLIFINFIENAFKHGVNSTTSQSWVKVSLIQQENEIHFNVKNSLPNKKAEQTNIKDVGGVGLDNVRKRLDLEYANNYQLNFSAENIFEVDLKIKLA